MRVMNAEDTIQAYVSKFAMASFLNDDLLNQLELFHFSAYSNVYIEEDIQHYLYFLVEGQVQCNHYQLNGNLAVIALSDPFCAIGDLEIAAGAARGHAGCVRGRGEGLGCDRYSRRGKANGLEKFSAGSGHDSLRC